MLSNRISIRKLFMPLMMVVAVASTVQAQDQRPEPKFWFGGSAAANLNFYTGTTQTLNAQTKAPAAFHKGFGVRPYGSILTEYRPNNMWGGMLNLAYDGRGGAFNEVMAPCNCPANLKTNLSYFTVEPSIRFAPFRNGFYLFAGVAYSVNLTNSFTYTQRLQPDVKGEFSDGRKGMFSTQIGAGYDIPLSSVTNPTQVQLSPFVSFHPYFGQDVRSVESWSLSTLRLGVALKFGKAPAKAVVKDDAAIIQKADDKVDFSVRAPLTVPAKRKINESFPLRNYVFFEEGSSEIPKRYVTLKKENAASFKSAQLQEEEPKDLTKRSERQITVYYNILNILGDRMRENPNANVTLIGASAGKGPEVGKSYAESIKRYLVDVFGINESRIKTEGRDMPLIPSEQPGSTTNMELLHEGDRRVDIVSSPDLLKPLQIKAILTDPMDSRIVFKNEGAETNLTSWSLEITDEKGMLQNFGPYTREQESISGNAILMGRPEGDYKVVMLGKTKDGNVIRKESKLHLVKNPEPKEEALRYSILFDFDKSQTVAAYDKFLVEEVASKISNNDHVIIHGHSDIIGDNDHNIKLSHQRAVDVKNTLEKAVLNSGKKGVTYQVYGFGPDDNSAPFENKSPEERFYNRTVIIDIVPVK